MNFPTPSRRVLLLLLINWRNQTNFSKRFKPGAVDVACVFERINIGDIEAFRLCSNNYDNDIVRVTVLAVLAAP